MKNTSLLILASTLFLDLLGFGLIIPLIPVYILHYGGKPWVGGALLASFSTMQFIFSPIWGRLSDKIGRRPLILLSLIGSAISFVAFGFAPNLAVLFVARVAAGILSAASLPVAQAYIADVTPPEKRASGMAVLGAAFGLGFVCGPALGGVLGSVTVFGLRAIQTPALFAACLCAVNFLWAFFALPESHTDRSETTAAKAIGVLDVFPAIQRALSNPQISAQLWVFTFATFAFTAVEASFSWLILLRFHDVLLHNAQTAWAAGHAGQALPAAMTQEMLEKAQTRATSVIFVIVGVTSLFVQGAVIGGLARKIGENKLVMFGSAILAATLLGIALAPTFWVLWITAAGLAIGSGVMNSSLSALITDAAPPNERGSLSGTQQGLGSLARMIAPPINNYMVGVDTKIPFLSSFVMMLVAFGLSTRLKPLSKSKPANPNEYPVPPAAPGRNGHAGKAAESSTEELPLR